MRDDIVTQAQEQFRASIDAESVIRRNYRDDYDFAAGDQWPDSVKRERELDNRPCLTINRLPSSIASVVADARLNSPTIQVHPVDSEEDPELAETLEGLIRQIEASSDADQAYDHALECAVRGGVGAFRICTDYAGDDTFDQEITIERIKNPMTVYFDPSAQKYDKSDGQYVFITEMVSKKEFQRRYPKAEEVNWNDSGYGDDEWLMKDSIRVAEYWCKKPEQKELALLQTGETIDITDLSVPVEQEGALGIVRRRKVDSHKIMRYVLAGNTKLEEAEWPGKYFPIVPVFGPELEIDGKTVYTSLIRYAKDAQRQYNYWTTALTEKVALSPKVPFVGTQKQFEGFERDWATANVKNHAFLAFNADPEFPSPPQRVDGSTIANGEISLIGQAIDDVKATTGIFDASLGAQGNETSGRAILARQREGASATFAWLDNLARSIRYAGRILVDLIPKIYDGERVIRILGVDGDDRPVQINTTVVLPTGEEVIVNDITVGKYDVTVATGPSYQTQRLEAADSMMQFIQAVPVAAQAAGDLIAKNMDWPGADEIAERLKKMLPPGLADDEEQQAPMPDPKEQLDLANSQATLEGKQLLNEQRRIDLAQDVGDVEGLIAEIVDARLAQLLAPQDQPPIEAVGF